MSSALLPAAPDADELALQLERLGERLEITLAPTAEEGWERVVRALDRSTRLYAEAGIELLRLKSEMPHGDFQISLDDRRIPRQRAQEAMQIARLLLHLSKSPRRAYLPSDSLQSGNKSINIDKFLSISPARAAALAAVEPEVLEQAIAEGAFDLDDVDIMPRDMLRREIRKLRRRQQQQSERMAKLSGENEELRRQLGGPPAGSEHPASVTRARAEAAALGDQALAVIAAIERHSWLLLEASDLGELRPQREKNIAAAAKPIMLHLGAVLSAAGSAYRVTRERLQAWLPEKDEWSPDDQPPPLTMAEAQRLAEWRDVHVRRLEWEAERREAERVGRGDIKRGRGRPRKPTSSGPRRPRGRPRKVT